MPRVNFHLAAQFVERFWFAQPLPGPPEGAKKTTGVLGRTEQMGGLHDCFEFIGWNEGYVPCASPANDHHFPLPCDVIQH
jgi:hypothetical protein